MSLALAISSCKKEDNKTMAPSTPPIVTSVGTTETAMIGDWICDGDSIYSSGSCIYDSTYSDWHLDLNSSLYADTTYGPGYMQSGWYYPIATPSTPYYWRVVDTGDPHYQLNCYVLSGYPFQYIMSLTPTTLILATNEGYSTVKRRLFHK